MRFFSMSFNVPELFYIFCEKWEGQLNNFSRTNEIHVGFSFFALRKLLSRSRDLFNVPGFLEIVKIGKATGQLLGRHQISFLFYGSAFLESCPVAPLQFSMYRHSLLLISAGCGFEGSRFRFFTWGVGNDNLFGRGP